ncbi:MAG: hypothetical protein WCK51_06175 [Armatimonadota bacterium]
MNWESTDNFGNLSVATSSASSLEELRTELESMIDVVFARTPEGVVFSVDKSYQEIAAPSDQQVTHVLTVPLLATLSAEDVQATLREVLAKMGREAAVQGTW